MTKVSEAPSKAASLVLPRNARSPRVRVVTDVSGPSRTKQSFKDECDVNVIMRRYEQTGVMPFADRAAAGRYLDTSELDYLEAMRVVADARSSFQSLSARVRDRFLNDPQRFLEFVSDERNREEARELGLLRADVGAGIPLARGIEASIVSDSGATSGVSEGAVSLGSAPEAPKAKK